MPDRAAVWTAVGPIAVTHVFRFPGPDPGGVAAAVAADDPAGARVVVFGHSHRQHCAERDGVLYLNPASAGPRRFHCPRSLARLELDGGRGRARLVSLD